ncbi:hypothetical protein [Demequina aurantiaca]|uniref:hypothetical protein n=1 Tax=Demequina aurantiaca TaxID=676200 RepID=UPI000784D1D1|nr:hypothetical protein [Demequina aurantiaca]
MTASETDHVAPAVRPSSKLPLYLLLALIAASVAYGFIAPALAPGAEGLQDGAIGLASALVITYLGSLVAGIVLIVAAVQARKGATWVNPTAIAAVVAWVILAVLMTVLMTGL